MEGIHLRFPTCGTGLRDENACHCRASLSRSADYLGGASTASLYG